MKHKTPKKPNEYLDQCAQRLAEKHHRRLQAMTREAINTLPKKRRSLWQKPVFVSAFSLFIISTVLFLQNAEEPETLSNNLLSQPVALPAWVMDTETPDTLIEHLDFYDWLAKQTEHQYTSSEKHITLVITQSAWSRFGQRFPSLELTQRFPRTTTYVRNVQK
ncbi:MAG TPA: hypothetical protein ENJ33_02305 [Thiothrix sp.]|nr:hypothetical protein [Thiothrix sp.]